jgi:hypothetical protein
VQVQPAAFCGADGSGVDMAVGDQPAGTFLEDDQEPAARSEAADCEDFAAVLVPALLDMVLMSQRPEKVSSPTTRRRAFLPLRTINR